jgi:hypothetical protein
VTPRNPPATGRETPSARDGREYPENLREYHAYDEQLLTLLQRLQPATFDDLSLQLDQDTRAALPNWLSSARWRGLVELDESEQGGVRRYVVTPQGVSAAA